MINFIIFIIVIHLIAVGVAKLGKQKDFVYPLSLMVALAILSTVLANKIVAVGNFFVPGGIIVFSATYLLCDIISEQWGRDYTKKAIWAGFLANAVIAISIYFTLILPSAPYAINISDAFKVALGMTPRIVFASFFSYLFSQYFNLWGFFYLKKITNDKYLWLRNGFSTVVAQFISTSLFILIAFYGVFPLWKMFVSLFILKVGLLIIDIPFIYLAKWWLNKSDKNNQKIDGGQKFGLDKTSDFKKLYTDNLDMIVNWSVPILPKSNFKIADYGGGNSIVSKKIIDELAKKNITNFSVENIDNDKNKFIEYKNLKNIYGDILSYDKKDQYNLSIARFLMHLFNNTEREQLLKNIYNNTKQSGYVLLGNFVIDDERNYNIKRKILDYIESKKHIKSRFIPKTVEIEKMLETVGFKIAKEKKVFYKISISDFYKNRFNLTDKEIKEVNKLIGVEEHDEIQVFILARKE